MSKHITPSIGPSGRLRLSDVEAVARVARDCPAETWTAITNWIEHAEREAEDWATHPDTPEDKRAGWCGRQRGLRDILRDLQALRTGGWRTWFPDVDEEDEPQPASMEGV